METTSGGCVLKRLAVNIQSSAPRQVYEGLKKEFVGSKGSPVGMILCKVIECDFRCFVRDFGPIEGFHLDRAVHTQMAKGTCLEFIIDLGLLDGQEDS